MIKESNLHLNFSVSVCGLEFFSEILHKKTDRETLMKDAYNLEGVLKRQFGKKELEFINILEKVFGSFSMNAQVEVYPTYFYIGAVNTENNKIILGQPAHCKFHYLGLIAHELSHIYVKNMNLNRLIEEIVCFSIEGIIIEAMNLNFSFKDIQYNQETDSLHRYALFYSKQYYKRLLTLGLKDFISSLNKIIPEKYKEIQIEKNIFSYLNKHGKDIL